MSNFPGESVVSALKNLEKIERWPRGSVLFNEGETPRGLFFLHSGTVDLEFSGRHGISKSLRTVHPGEVIGLSYAISDAAYDCTARAHTKVEVGFVSVTELRRMLNEDPSLWLTLAQFLSEDLGSCWSSMRTLTGTR